MREPSTTQLERRYARLYDKVTRGSGYQPFGYDRRTIEIYHPGFTAAWRRLRQLWKDAAERELREVVE